MTKLKQEKVLWFTGFQPNVGKTYRIYGKSMKTSRLTFYFYGILLKRIIIISNLKSLIGPSLHNA